MAASSPTATPSKGGSSSGGGGGGMGASGINSSGSDASGGGTNGGRLTSAAIAPLLCYSFSSIGMTLMNKYIVGVLQFKLSFLSLLIQGSVVVLLLYTCAYFNVIQLKPFRQDIAKQWAPVTIMLCLMLYTGFKSLEFISIPLFTIFKNLTIIAIAYGERFIWNTPVSSMVLSSFALMVLSAVMGGFTDLEYNLVGYVWMFANCITSAAYVLYQRVVIKATGSEDFESVYYNNLLSLPILFVMSLWDFGSFLGQASLASNSDGVSSFSVFSSKLLWSLLVSGVTSFMISYSSSWCLRVTSSTTYSMAGAFNKLPLAIAGMLFFNYKTTVGSILSVLAGVGAGFMYAYAKTQPPKMVSLSDLTGGLNRRAFPRAMV